VVRSTKYSCIRRNDGVKAEMGISPECFSVSLSLFSPGPLRMMDLLMGSSVPKYLRAIRSVSTILAGSEKSVRGSPSTSGNENIEKKAESARMMPCSKKVFWLYWTYTPGKGRTLAVATTSGTSCRKAAARKRSRGVLKPGCFVTTLQMLSAFA